MLVGVTARRLAAGRVTGWHADGVGERSKYLERVRAAGGLPVVLDPAVATEPGATLATGAVERLVERLDAVLLTGGPDVAPGCYHEAPHATVYGTDDVVDGFEIALARAALDARLPLLAICRGIQVLNVACGGTLHQHIPELSGVSPHGRPGEAGGEWLHTVMLEPDSRLAQVMGSDRPACSCHHHQSVDRVGDGLRVVGRAGDGIVEAVEPDNPDRGGFVLAVQWHPEDTAADDRAQQQLFDALIEAGRATN
ncbi:MAG TPA: gamma-glutamyl-gamma-aminobutyrate hydrolase family protein [Acidimicrobiia bacterium]